MIVRVSRRLFWQTNWQTDKQPALRRSTAVWCTAATVLKKWVTKELAPLPATTQNENQTHQIQNDGISHLQSYSNDWKTVRVDAFVGVRDDAVTLQRFGWDVQMWDLHSDSNNMVALVCSNLVDDKIPISYDACSWHDRQFEFHPCPHTVLYAQPGWGRSRARTTVPLGGERDALYTQELLLLLGKGDNGNTIIIELQEPANIFGLEWCYDGIAFSELGTFALVNEYRLKDCVEWKWKVDIL
jgi:hypothetical protein